MLGVECWILLEPVLLLLLNLKWSSFRLSLPSASTSFRIFSMLFIDELLAGFVVLLSSESIELLSLN